MYNTLNEGLFSRIYPDKLPPFSSRFPGRLESILGNIQLQAELLDLDVVAVGIAYFVHLNKGHPFYNGNKRLAFFFTDVWYHLNNCRLDADIDLLLQISIYVAESKLSTDDLKQALEPIFYRIVTHKLDGTKTM